ncbi:hypothetical protein [Schleiferilactobacillus shenzhenensis]|uniref:Uncharacterized protein n=1 Tax=Schleiferilactobacillus shenzhenensis LY-73 TaxID=1231336 RepID=U4TQP7_9LACO|nr:hypothetical protein [Schleiferilactobacillus shenzhenensis]ERL64233.1 hypothetical protein L248_1511 [Schleiferilactobacillus shenzhenensis LY-73]
MKGLLTALVAVSVLSIGAFEGAYNSPKAEAATTTLTSDGTFTFSLFSTSYPDSFVLHNVPYNGAQYTVMGTLYSVQKVPGGYMGAYRGPGYKNSIASNQARE